MHSPLSLPQSGRPAEVWLPGKNPISLFKYLGARAVMRQEQIVTAFGGGQTSEHKAELLDHLGRMIEVCAAQLALFG